MLDNYENIFWLGHASFLIKRSNINIYIDPWQLGDNFEPADLILITHAHRDHCSPEDVRKIQTENTKIITVKESMAKLEGDIRILEPFGDITIGEIRIQAVPAYNVNKFRSPGIPFHPKEKKYIGFILTIDGQKIYHAGDTDLIPEMQDLDVDIALIPVSGTYVMTFEEAAEAIEIISPKVVIPMHIGRGIGSIDSGEKLISRTSIPVKLLSFET